MFRQDGIGAFAAVSHLRGELAPTEWTFRDGRHRAFLLQSGKGRVTTPEGDVGFAASCLIWLPESADVRLRLEPGSRGLSLAVSEFGLAGALQAGGLAGQVRATLGRPLIHQRLESRQAVQLAAILESIGAETADDLPAGQEALRNLLTYFFLRIWRLSGPVMREARPLPRTIMQQFLHAVDVHFRDHWTIARYAAEIGISADHLTATVKRVGGRSPLAIIHARLMHEAEMLLNDSTLQIAEIALQLGFSDPAYFSRFYRRIAGYSPKMQRRGRAGAQNAAGFAAWP